MGKRKSYHHGNLRQALVEATLELITARGPQGFTLAEAARQAGVSLTGSAEPARASERAMGVLTKAAETLMAHLPAANRPPAAMAGHHV